MVTPVMIAIDLVAIVILTFGLYFPRHRRKDLVVAFLTVNVGVLALSIVLASATVGLGVGLGLFGVLSIIRLRSSEIKQHEIAYYFASLALGLLAGLSTTVDPLILGLMALLLAVMLVGDHPRLFGTYRLQTMQLDSAYTDEASLIAALDRDARRSRAPRDGAPRRPHQRLDPRRGALPAHPGSANHRNARTIGCPMTTSTALATLRTISLEELNEKAALQTRVDRKYALTRREADVVLGGLDHATRVLEIDGQQSSSYESVYFDTPDLLSYRMAAHARRRRFKVRTRSYLDTQRGVAGGQDPRCAKHHGEEPGRPRARPQRHSGPLGAGLHRPRAGDASASDTPASWSWCRPW